MLVSSDVISLIIGNEYSIDVGAWWPFALLFLIILHSVYSGLFILIDKINPASQKYVIIYNPILAIILIILTILYYAVSTDWAAIIGEVMLALFQAILHSDIAYYLSLGIFLIIHLVYTLFNKKW
jgi:hypothetical protein